MKPKELTEEEALKRLAASCARREQCSGQMRGRMRQWALPEEAQQRIIDYLTAHKYIDDERFSRAYAADKVKFNKWGRRKIETALTAYGVDRQTVAAVLDGIPDSDYLESLLPLLRAKDKSLHGGLTPYQRRYKLMSYGLSRGYDMALVSRCVGFDGADPILDLPPEE